MAGYGGYVIYLINAYRFYIPDNSINTDCSFQGDSCSSVTESTLSSEVITVELNLGNATANCCFVYSNIVS